MTTVGTDIDLQRRVLVVLVGTQVLGGIGVAMGFAVSSLFAARFSGSDVVGGAALTFLVIGSAIAALLLSRVAQRAGRRPSLALGYAVGVVGALGAAVAAALESWPALLVSFMLMGGAAASGFAARFAATDLADPQRRARSLAVVVWATTVGAVIGPNLADPVQDLAGAVGLAPASGPFLLGAVAFALATAVALVGLRPDPLLVARERAGEPARAPARGNGAAIAALRASPGARLAIAGIALCHLVMIALMSMTPVHIEHAGGSLQLVGLVISVHVAGMYALSPLVGWLADRVGRATVLAGGAGLQVVAGGVSATAGGGDAGLLIVALFALGLGWSAALVAGSALLTESVPLAVRPAVQGLADVTMNVSGAVGGVLAGLTVAGFSFGVLGIGAAVLAVGYLVSVSLLGARRAGAPAPG